MIVAVAIYIGITTCSLSNAYDLSAMENKQQCCIIILNNMIYSILKKLVRGKKRNKNGETLCLRDCRFKEVSI